jgi:hypothetical protein
VQRTGSSPTLPAGALSVEKLALVEFEVLCNGARTLRYGAQWLPARLDIQPGDLCQQIMQAF